MNPSEGGDYDVTIATTADTTPLLLKNEVIIPTLVELSTCCDPRGLIITVVALGV